MSNNTVLIDFTDNEKSLIEVVLGHLAQEEEAKDAEAAEGLREIINTVRSDAPLSKLDAQTVWFTLDRKVAVDFPAQPYDEDEVGDSVQEKIEEALGGIPETLQGE